MQWIDPQGVRRLQWAYLVTISLLFLITLVPYSPLFYVQGWAGNQLPAAAIPFALLGALLGGAALLANATTRREWTMAACLAIAAALNIFLYVVFFKWYVLD